MLQIVLLHLFSALDYLHIHGNIIHTGTAPDMFFSLSAKFKQNTDIRADNIWACSASSVTMFLRLSRLQSPKTPVLARKLRMAGQ